MARIEGAALPDTEAEEEFMIGVNQLAKDAYDAGTDPEDISAMLTFMSASILKRSEPPEETPDVPEGPEKTEECPDCGEPIRDVKYAIGGQCIVKPCACRMHVDRLDGWGEAESRFKEVGE